VVAALFSKRATADEKDQSAASASVTYADRVANVLSAASLQALLHASDAPSSLDVDQLLVSEWRTRVLHAVTTRLSAESFLDQLLGLHAHAAKSSKADSSPALNAVVLQHTQDEYLFLFQEVCSLFRTCLVSTVGDDRTSVHALTNGY